jgi:hypothetical protein
MKKLLLTSYFPNIEINKYDPLETVQIKNIIEKGWIPKILLLSLMLFSLFGCSEKSYVPKHEKKSFIIKNNKMPSSINETFGRYRKEL